MVDLSKEKENSTCKKTPVMEGAPSEGANKTPTKGDITPAMGEQQFPPLGMITLPSSSNQARSSVNQNNALAAQRRLQAKPFASTVAQDWYNLELKTSNEFIYSKLNGCFRSIQFNKLQLAKYWPTQIKGMVLSMVSHYNQEKDKVQNITKTFKNFVNIPTPLRVLLLHNNRRLVP